jgi:phosphinothricin acetyltransferase
MEIRKANIDDLPQINSIYNQAVDQRFCTAHLEPVNMEYRKNWFREHQLDRYPVYVATENEMVLGWVSVGSYRSGREALDHVAEVSYYVDNLYRGRGIGGRLMDHVIKQAPELGLSVLIAILLDKNPASIALLKKHGFALWGRMPGIAKIDDQKADHLFYGLHLGDDQGR